MIEILKANLQIIEGSSTACVEAAHIYTDEQPGLEHQMSAVIGTNVSRILEEMGVDVNRMLFVDDFNADSKDLDIHEYESFITKHGFIPDVVVMETTLVEDAKEIVRVLEGLGLTEVNKNGATILKKKEKREKEVVLKKSPSLGSVPACSALDAALYIKKFEHSGVCVTVLHERWKNQQDSVKRVITALGMEIPVLDVYYSDTGDVSVDFDY